ncbi:MAG: hypothetical protein FJ272_06195, partial [Planctomycetes bacterium]|nr:hypothetical protein [Planctomycetota bacterium]
MQQVSWSVVALMVFLWCGHVGAEPKNLCPNPGAEAAGEGNLPAGWRLEGGGERVWATDAAHSGQRSLKITSPGGTTASWLSDLIPLPKPGRRFALSVRAKLANVTGKGGAAIVLYTMGADGKRNGQTAHLTLGGAGNAVAATDWTQYFSVSEPLGEHVKYVCVNLRLYGASGTAWFDDIVLTEFEQYHLKQARAIRRGLALRNAAIVCSPPLQRHAANLRDALKLDLPIVGDDVHLEQDKRDLIVLGNLTNNRVAEHLYLHSYTCEDLNFPGKGGYVLRPLTNPLGFGQNFLVVGASDEVGLGRAIERLAQEKPAADGVLRLPLMVQTGEGYGGLSRYPWPGSGPRREMAHVAAYMKSGDLDHVRKYREEVLKSWFIPDEQLFAEDHSLHLYYVTRTQSWDLISDNEVFSDEDRLKTTNRLLDMLRSRQGYGYGGLGGSRMSRENHGTRAAHAFYFGWRHFHKYYRDELGAELLMWRKKLEDFWRWPLGSSRSYEDSLSQHALGGSLVNALDVALMEPAWSTEFFEQYAQRMGERCIAICNNMGQVVLLGDTGTSDFPGSVFAMLGYKFRDGRYAFMLKERGNVGISTDEPLRGFDIGLPTVEPKDHVGLHVVPADRLYYDTALQRKDGVPFERAFDKLTFRSGFGNDDEYLMLDGHAGGSHSYDDANTIGEFSGNGR